MSFNDRPIHLPASKVPHQEPSATVPVWLTQSNLDGLCALIQWLNAVERTQGKAPGSFELVMHYRQIESAIRAASERS